MKGLVTGLPFLAVLLLAIVLEVRFYLWASEVQQQKFEQRATPTAEWCMDEDGRQLPPLLGDDC